jgi:hypothetical protein
MAFQQELHDLSRKPVALGGLPTRAADEVKNVHARTLEYVERAFIVQISYTISKVHNWNFHMVHDDIEGDDLSGSIRVYAVPRRTLNASMNCMID